MPKLDQLMQNMPASIDCGLITSHINRRYFTGFASSAGIVVVTRQKAFLLIDFRYFERASQQAQGVEVVLMKHPASQIKEILEKYNCKTIGLETQSVTMHEFQEYKSMLSEYDLCDSAEFQQTIDALRIIKTPEEIRKIAASQEITDLAFEHMLGYITEGLTEKQIAFELNQFILNRAQQLAFDTIVVSGRNSSSPHGVPTDKTVQDGDFITMDFGARLDGYCSDMTRTVCVGKPSEEQIVLYKTVLFGQSIGLEFLQAGKKTADADKLVREYFASQGVAEFFGHNLGHGVGLEIHEQPVLSAKSNETLQPGMIVTVEPGLYIPGNFGIRIEDMVAIPIQSGADIHSCSLH